MKGIFFFLLLACIQSEAQLQLPRFFSDNMVLQRDMPIHFWGRGIPGQSVNINFSGETRESQVKPDSTWSLFLPRKPASREPQAVTVESGDRSITLHHILIGDIWICSGQSNMEFPLAREAHAAAEYPCADHPMIRLLNPPPAGRYVYGVAYTDSLLRRLTTDSFYLWDDWAVCDSNTARTFSAVAYYFARKIVSMTNIPIGLINLSIGGAPIETFISRSALSANPAFASKVKGNWLDNDALPSWIRQRGKENVGAGYRYSDDFGPNHAYKPGFAFDCGVEPLLPMPIKGVIWYQGESNSLEPERVKEYLALMRLLIDDYRKRWHNPQMPFYWVQLSSIDTTHYQSRYWPEFRDGQRRLLAQVSHGGMAVCSDIGAKDNVHPTDKKDVGERMAYWALKQDYRLPVIPSGPLPFAARYERGRVLVYFKYGGGLRTSDNLPVRGFSLDGKQDCRAIIQGATIRILASSKPAFICYGWHPFSTGNLINSESLPASTFKINVE